MCAVRTRARAPHLFIEETLISGPAVCLFFTNRHCCEILWENFTNRTWHYWPVFTLFRSHQSLPPTYCLSPNAHTCIVSLSLDLSWHRWIFLGNPSFFLGFLSTCKQRFYVTKMTWQLKHDKFWGKILKRKSQKLLSCSCTCRKGALLACPFCLSSSFVCCICLYELISWSVSR